jgi:hypothetical protein
LLGTGESDHPDLEYTPEVLLDSLADLVADAEPVLTVASSLTGAYALRLAAAGRLPGDLALITPTGLPGTATSRSGRVGALAQQALLRTPLGDALVAGVGSRPSVGWFLRNRAYADASLVTDEVIGAHVRVAGRPDAKQLLVAFITQRLALALTPDEVGSVRPLVLWGRGERFSRVESAERWRAAGAEVVVLPSGLPQAEQPDEVAASLLARLAR